MTQSQNATEKVKIKSGLSIEKLQAQIDAKQAQLKIVKEQHLQQIAELKKMQKALQAKAKAEQAQKDRKNDARRKILLGAYLLDKMQNEQARTRVMAELDTYLTKEHDRELFSDWGLAVTPHNKEMEF